MKGLVAAIDRLTVELKRYNDSHSRSQPRSNMDADLFRANYDQTEIDNRDISDQLSALPSHLPSIAPFNQEVQREGSRGKGKGKL